MRCDYSLAAILLLRFGVLVQATKIILTNDDGWAVANIRALNQALIDGGFDVCCNILVERHPVY